MWIAGINVRSGAVADLALRLDKAGRSGLAERFGIAFDTNSQRVALLPGDRQAVLSVLTNAQDGLSELRDALRRQLGTSPTG